MLPNLISRFRAKASALIVAGPFEGEIVRRGQRQCKRGMLQSAGQDDTGEQMNLPCRREAEPHAPGPATKFGFQILASCGSHKGGKTAYRQAKNLSTAFSRLVTSRDICLTGSLAAARRTAQDALVLRGARRTMAEDRYY
jgi:hypothetical protein